MHKLYTFALIIAGTFILFSFSTNPPDGNTGAPGDQFCVQCHIQTNPSQNGTISVEGFPASITPNETYMLTAVNRLTEGTAVRAGFQVTILSPSNTRAGNFTNPSAKSAVSIFGGRQYWDHNPAVEYPDSNVVKWTVMWTAPDLPSGSKITWYAAGNLADGNFQNIGDRIVASSGSGSIVLAGTEQLNNEPPVIFPNPGVDYINIHVNDETPFEGQIIFYDIYGRKAGMTSVINGLTETPLLPPGVYLIEIQDHQQIYLIRWSKI